MNLNCEKTNRRISLFAFDLDGTLLNSSSQIGEFTLSKISEAVQKGVKITICSGRMPAMQQVYLSQLNFCGPYVACNGALVAHSSNGLLFEKPISHQQLKKLCAFTMEEKLHACIQTIDKLYFTSNNPRIQLVEEYNCMAEQHGLSKVSIEEFNSVLSDKAVLAYKAMIYAPGKQKFEKIRAFLNKGPEISYTFSNEYLFDIMYKGIDKGSGIKKIADYYSIPYEEVCAFGDYDNDLPFFNAVGTSVAMGNAPEGLKATATFITDTNNNDGVGKAIEALEAYFV